MNIKKYFKKFYNMQPYINIDKKEWKFIIETYEKDDIVETLSEVLFTYPPPIPKITEQKMLKDLKKLKGVWWYDLLIEGQWFPRNERESRYDLTFDNSNYYFKKCQVKSSFFFLGWGSKPPGPLD